MARTPKTDRPVRREISLPESLDARIQLLLYSPVERRIPHGAVSAFFTELAREALSRLPPTPIEEARTILAALPTTKGES